ncbi:unnamed protein product [Larinioides sclopetarius]|uniref:THAP-type domain-containing protein n=1 Tax=Larinioides sclopetarius TaxID=280406 RepID=A0AAV1ZD44_9ARAC
MASSKTNMYKLMASPNSRTTRITCSAYGCDMKGGTNKLSEIKMFTFPRNPFRRRRWELATRRANWKSHSRSRICSKHFITGRPSNDPNHPDYVPSVFVFNKNTQNLKSLSRNAKSKTRRKLLAGESCANPACHNSSSREGKGVITSCGIKGYCSKCFSSESVSSAFNQSLEPLNHTLTQMMLKLTDMEEEREQLRNELALCRGEILQLREAHRDCMAHLPSTSTHSISNSSVLLPSATSLDETEVLQSVYSDEQPDVYDSDLLPSQYLEQIYHQPDGRSKGKRQSRKKRPKELHSDEEMSILDNCPRQSPKKKRVMKNSCVESKGTSESPKQRKSSDTSSPITIIYLKP